MSDIMAMKYEDWLRGCVHHDGRKGNVYLPCDTVLEIADWIEAHRDVAPVVRCKDCIWFDKQRCVCHNPRYGDGYANYQPPNTNDEYWCADGERKNND